MFQKLSYVLTLGSSLLVANTCQAYVYGMVTKSLDNPYFSLSHTACADKAAELNGECLLVGPEQGFADVSGAEQAAIVDDLVARRAVDVLAVAVMNEVTVGPALVGNREPIFPIDDVLLLTYFGFVKYIHRTEPFGPAFRW